MRNTTKPILAFILAIAAVLAIGGHFASPHLEAQGEVTRIRVGVIPDEDAADLNRRYRPLLGHLTRQSGLDFELVIPASYADLLQRFAQQELELAYFGGFTFVKAHLDQKAVPLVMRDVDVRFTTYFFVRRDSALRDCFNLDCPELAGAVLSFGSRLSTSGHLMPRHFLNTQKGLVPEDFFGEVLYSGAHDRTIYDVRDGAAEIGAVNSEIYRTMQRDGRLSQDELQVVWETPPYPDNVWAVSDRMTEELQTRLRDAFLSLDPTNRDHEKILSGMGAQSFVPVGWQEFEPVLEAATSMGLLTRD